MDIDLLSRMVGELILEHDQVGLPGVGTFVAEMVPATFSDKGYTIHPPYRRLSFYPSRLEDSLLIKFYAESNQLSREAAAAYITQYLAELKGVLEERKTIVLPGLGRLRATRENTLFFVPDENLDIYPAAVGLEPVSLKSLAEEEQEPVVIDVPAPVVEPEPEPEPEPKPEPIPEPEPEPEPEPVLIPVPEPEEIADQVGNDEIAAGADEETVGNDEETVSTNEETVSNDEETVGAEEATASTEEESVGNEEETAGAEEEKVEEAQPEEPRTRRATYPAAWIHDDWKEPVRKGLPGIVVFLLVLIGLAILGLVAFVVLARVAPDFIDTLLYTPDELRIINY